MKTLLLIVAVALALTGCATPPNLQTQLTDFCAVATPELASFQAVQADLSPKAQSALATAGPILAAVCAPGVIATSDNLQQLTVTALPALTIVAVEYAAAKK
jgi:hypothetical protein